MQPLVEQARHWVDVEIAWLAERCGAGEVGPDAGALIQAAGRMWFCHLDVTRQAVKAGGSPKLYLQAAMLADKAKAHIIAARDLVVAAAKNAPKPDPIDLGAALRGDS